jgi:hypothetical protein
MSERLGTTEARLEGFYWVILGQNPPEIAYWERGEWWLAGDPKPWHPEAVTVASDRLVFKPRLRREANAERRPARHDVEAARASRTAGRSA